MEWGNTFQKVHLREAFIYFSSPLWLLCARRRCLEICRRFRFFDFGAMIRVLKSVDGAAPDGSCQARRKKQPARRMEGIEKENRGIDGSPVQRVKNHLGERVDRKTQPARTFSPGLAAKRKLFVHCGAASVFRRTAGLFYHESADCI